MQRIDIEIEFRRPVAELFALLSDHEKLGPVLGARIKRTRDGTDSPNGLGSVRTLRIGPLPSFDETVTAFRKDELIEYRITRGTPLRSHKGVMRFSATPSGGSRLRYTIEFASLIPMLGPLIRAALDTGIRKGLAKLR